jgi:hypothetical protein
VTSHYFLLACTSSEAVTQPCDSYSTSEKAVVHMCLTSKDRAAVHPDQWQVPNPGLPCVALAPSKWLIWGIFMTVTV